VYLLLSSNCHLSKKYPKKLQKKVTVLKKSLFLVKITSSIHKIVIFSLSSRPLIYLTRILTSKSGFNFSHFWRNPRNFIQRLKSQKSENYQKNYSYHLERNILKLWIIFLWFQNVISYIFYLKIEIPKNKKNKNTQNQNTQQSKYPKIKIP